jgi:hypothetical protein
MKFKAMRFASIFILLILCSCSLRDEQQVQSLPQIISTPEIQKTVSLNPNCQNVANILGFADIIFDESTKLSFYAQPDSWQQPAQTLRFYNDIAILSYSFRAEGEKSYPELQPERHKLDYSIFELSVVNKRDGWLWDWLEVIVDEQTNETLWVQTGVIVRFKDWFENFKKSASVERKNKETNPIRREPSETAEQIEFDGKDRFKVEKMQGNWILIFQRDEDEPSKKSNSSVPGWIKWRDENGCLLIYTYPFA